MSSQGHGTPLDKSNAENEREPKDDRILDIESDGQFRPFRRPSDQTKIDKKMKLKIDMMERDLTDNDFPPFIRQFVPEDILNQMRNGNRYIFRGKDLLEASDRILNLAADLAIAQLIQNINDQCYGKFSIDVVRFTTRNNVEKQSVLGKIKVAFNKENMVGSGKRFDGVLIFDGSKCKSPIEAEDQILGQLGFHVFETIAAIFKLHKQGKHYLLLWMDGDGDKNVKPWDLLLFKYITYVGVVVFITTESAAVKREIYGLIYLHFHLLPWVVFCRNVGIDLHWSSSDIQRIAMQIVEECLGHLHENVLVARLLKNVKDVEIWEHTLQKLRFTSPDVNIVDGMSRVMVNAFIVFWESLDPIKKLCLKICVSVSGIERLGVYDSDLTSKWIRLLETAQAAEDFLEELLNYSILRRQISLFWNGNERMQMQEEIYQTLASWNRLNPEVIMKPISHNDDAWHSAVVIDAQLSDLPQSPNCTHLRALALNNPDLTELTQLFFQQMPELRTLDLSQTRLRNLPSSVINLTELKELNLHNCKLFMDLPLEIEQLTNLQKLHLDGTQITNLPHSPKWPRLSVIFARQPSFVRTPAFIF
ncbi:hypothetical protein L6164_037330 [Bauhinia variegata]|uniref:Uncharacterized protein n=1 Tax=Bauhinia variegata TaxID=167791 RepID=A0ACB9KK15_BAUVA|nr:hypothetical protein L6164_037330 [Bauhinia variegata]